MYLRCGMVLDIMSLLGHEVVPRARARSVPCSRVCNSTRIALGFHSPRRAPRTFAVADFTPCASSTLTSLPRTSTDNLLEHCLAFVLLLKRCSDVARREVPLVFVGRLHVV